MNRSILKWVAVILFAGLVETYPAINAKAQNVNVSFQMFYDNLSPYGQWIYEPAYGNVWVPNESGDFRPYGSRGRWVMTDYGNTWVSDDPWGWAVYHYGRWTYDNYYGWIWVPGYEWAPAWVSWRYGGGYAGWAPLGPNMSISISSGMPDSWWIFIQPQYLYVDNCYRYWRGPAYNRTYVRQTTYIHNYYEDNYTRVRYNYGPRADAIQRDTRQPVQVYRVSQMGRPGAAVVQRNEVNIYRPRIERGSRESARPANVVKAPRQIGRPQPHNTMNGNRQPEFRQQMNGRTQEPVPVQRNAPQRERMSPTPRQANPQMERSRVTPQPQGRPEPQRMNRQPAAPQREQRTEPRPERPQIINRREEQPRNQPEPQRFERSQMNPRPQRESRQMEQPQRPQIINRREQQPINRPQPQMRQSQPQPQMRQQAPPQQMRQPQPREERGNSGHRR